jgi:hypothetical protein
MTAARRSRRWRTALTLFGPTFTLSCTVTSLVGAATTERIVLDYRTGLAIHGYDPVAYFTDAVAGGYDGISTARPVRSVSGPARAND